jgi:predicted hotdog family 3-hydroxylacyl-ACP dehydratase
MLSGMSHSRIDLTDAVQTIRDQLIAAAARGSGQPVSFEVGTVQLEFTVQLEADAQARGGFKAWVLSGEAAAGVKAGHTQKVTLNLTPRNAYSHGSLEIGDEDLGRTDHFG